MTHPTLWILAAAFCAIALFTTGCSEEWFAEDCAEIDPDTMPVERVRVDDYATSHYLGTSRPPDHPLIHLVPDDDHRLHVRVVNDDLLELAFMRDGQVVVETYAVREKREELHW